MVREELSRVLLKLYLEGKHYKGKRLSNAHEDMDRQSKGKIFEVFIEVKC